MPWRAQPMPSRMHLALVTQGRFQISGCFVERRVRAWPPHRISAFRLAFSQGAPKDSPACLNCLCQVSLRPAIPTSALNIQHLRTAGISNDSRSRRLPLSPDPGDPPPMARLAERLEVVQAQHQVPTLFHMRRLHEHAEPTQLDMSRLRSPMQPFVIPTAIGDGRAPGAPTDGRRRTTDLARTRTSSDNIRTNHAGRGYSATAAASAAAPPATSVGCRGRLSLHDHLDALPRRLATHYHHRRRRPRYRLRPWERQWRSHCAHQCDGGHRAMGRGGGIAAPPGQQAPASRLPPTEADGDDGDKDMTRTTGRRRRQLRQRGFGAPRTVTPAARTAREQMDSRRQRGEEEVRGGTATPVGQSGGRRSTRRRHPKRHQRSGRPPSIRSHRRAASSGSRTRGCGRARDLLIATTTTMTRRTDAASTRRYQHPWTPTQTPTCETTTP